MFFITKLNPTKPEAKSGTLSGSPNEIAKRVYNSDTVPKVRFILFNRLIGGS
jgi:hypothetical protein